MCTTSLGQPTLPAVYIQHPIVSVPNVEMEGRAEHAMAAIAGLAIAGRETESGPRTEAIAAVVDRITVADDPEAIFELFTREGWTDGLPIVPPTAARVAEMLACTDLAAGASLGPMAPRWGEATITKIAVNAVMAGCKPEYFPVVVTAVKAILAKPFNLYGVQGTTNPASPVLIVNGPIAGELDINARGNLFGPGFRANATIGRAIRLTCINAFGLRPHLLDQATQGTPAKYTACIAENEEDSPWPALHTDFGLQPSDSSVTAMIVRSCLHIEARHTTVPEQLATDIAGTISRTGALIHRTISALVVLGPEHARLLSGAGWGKADLQRFIYDHAVRSHAELAAVGKDAISRHTRWRLPADHPDAMPDLAGAEAHPEGVRVLNSPAAVLVAVAGANNAGVSAVIETFGPRGGPPAVIRVAEDRGPGTSMDGGQAPAKEEA